MNLKIMPENGSFSEGDSEGTDDRDSGEVLEDPSTTHPSGTSGQVSDESTSTIKEQITKKESQHVLRLRLLVVSVLVITAAAISYAVYWLTTDGESDSFEAQYQGASDKLLACTFLSLVSVCLAIMTRRCSCLSSRCFSQP